MTDPRQLIYNFIKEFLDGDINRLTDFNIAELEGNKTYGACLGGSFDADDTNLMRAIYATVFVDVWPNLNSLTLQERKFRGDTMNTFSTLFGKPTAQNRYLGLDKFSPSSETYDRVRRFRSQVYTLGNMMVLPNVYVDRYSLNTYRGTHHLWRDYLDKFLNELYVYMTCPEKTDERLSKLMHANQDAFERYKGAEGFRTLANNLLLTDYLDDAGKPLDLFTLVYHWKGKMGREDYFEAVNRYLSFCEKVISKRGTTMVKRLQKLI
ncbi:MAG: hypothetical protein SPI30_08190 [Prevotella sp.]|nr:hypothetical protein [Prevotella sp.]